VSGAVLCCAVQGEGGWFAAALCYSVVWFVYNADGNPSLWSLFCAVVSNSHTPLHTHTHTPHSHTHTRTRALTRTHAHTLGSDAQVAAFVLKVILVPN
jgi:hypothetical protein